MDSDDLLPPHARSIPNAPDDPPPIDPNATRGRRQEVPPHDLEAQRALLGAAMLEPDAASVAASVPPEAWYGSAHREIAEAVNDLEQSGEPVDAHLIADRLGPIGLDRVGGLDELMAIMSTCPAPLNAPAYARVVRAKHRLREIIAAATHASRAAYDEDATAAIAHLTAAIDIAPDDDTIADAATLAPRYLELLERRESGETTAIPTGMHDLDDIIGGLHPGNLMVVGARTGQGKTATLCQLTLNVARAGRRVFYVSLEMPWPELFDRWVGNIARVNTRRLRRGEVREHWREVSKAVGEIAQTGIRVARPTTLTVPAIRAEARHHKADVVLVDYLQLVHAVGRRNTNRENDVGEVSRSLKGVALALDIPVVAAAQLNRNLESRTTKKPELHDLRDSGQLEQDADVVVMAYRPSTDDNEADPADLDLIVRKNRHGELATAHMTFMGPFQAVESRAPESRIRHVRSSDDF